MENKKINYSKRQMVLSNYIEETPYVLSIYYVIHIVIKWNMKYNIYINIKINHQFKHSSIK